MSFKDQFQEQPHAPIWTPAGLWQRLSSMRFALWLLLIIALGSILGVYIGDEYPTNVMGWRELAAQKAGPVLFRFLDFFQLFDTFRSWWYRLLLGVLALSLTACILKRSQGVVRRAFRATFLGEPSQYEQFRQHARFTIEGSDPFAALTAPLRKTLYRVVDRSGDGGARLLSASRGGISRFGPILTHLGLLVLVIGGLISAVLGLKTMVWLAPGDEIDSLDVGYFSESSEGEKEDPQRGLLPLGLDLRLDDFEIEYNDEGMIKQYRSSVTVTPQVGDPYKQIISVNHPLRTSGFNFYQASYQASHNSVESLQVAIMDSTRAVLVPAQTVTLGERFDLPEPGLQAVAERFFGHAMVGEGGVYNASFEHKNPAVLFRIFRGEEELWQQWAFARFRDMHMGQEQPLHIVLVDYEPAYLTGLEVTKEPATWLILVGFGLCTLGLILSFAISHRRLWAVALPGADGAWQVSVAATTTRDTSLFGKDFQHWIEAWQGSAGVHPVRRKGKK